MSLALDQSLTSAPLAALEGAFHAMVVRSRAEPAATSWPWGQGLPSQEASGRKRRPRALRQPFRLFDKARKSLSRGGAAR